ncbi:MAG: SpoIIIAC/SpoIIIAD family protein [Lachnospiraceae bacterium]
MIKGGWLKTDIIHIALIGVVGSLLALKLKTYKPEFGIILSVALCLLFLFYAVEKLTVITSFLNSIQNLMDVNPIYVAVLLKLIGIAYVCEFSSNLCKDAGYQSIATQVEIIGKLTILVVSMPIINTLLETIYKFLK